MKKIKSFYYEIVIANIYLLDINKREYDESSVYDGIYPADGESVKPCHFSYLWEGMAGLFWGD